MSSPPTPIPATPSGGGSSKKKKTRHGPHASSSEQGQIQLQFYYHHDRKTVKVSYKKEQIVTLWWGDEQDPRIEPVINPVTTRQFQIALIGNFERTISFDLTPDPSKNYTVLSVMTDDKYHHVVSCWLPGCGPSDIIPDPQAPATNSPQATISRGGRIVVEPSDEKIHLKFKYGKPVRNLDGDIVIPARRVEYADIGLKTYGANNKFDNKEFRLTFTELVEIVEVDFDDNETILLSSDNLPSGKDYKIEVPSERWVRVKPRVRRMSLGMEIRAKGIQKPINKTLVFNG